jgi:hypothetical protein
MRVAFFTAGTVGAGHVARGSAIGRGLTRAGFRGTYRMFGPQTPFAAVANEGWESVTIDERGLTPREAALQTDLARRLVAFAPDLLLIDMFWAPLRWVLPLAGCEAWLLLRSHPRAWLDGPPGFPFDASQFARIVAVEPLPSPSPAITDTIDPVVLVGRDEQRPSGALRERLGVPEGKRLVVVAHAGMPGELRFLQPTARADEEVVVLDLHASDAIFPLAEWLGGMDRLYTGGGYNSFWEARWLGWADRTTFTPFPRRNDDQRWRIAMCSSSRIRENGADTLARWIVGR